MILINSAVSRRQRSAFARAPFFKRSSWLGGTISAATAESCRATSGRIEFSAAVVTRKSQSSGVPASLRISVASAGSTLVRAQHRSNRFSGHARSLDERVINALQRGLREDSTISQRGIAGGLLAERAFERYATGSYRTTSGARISRSFVVRAAKVKGFCRRGASVPRIP